MNMNRSPAPYAPGPDDTHLSVAIATRGRLQIGVRAITVAFSDLAGMGASPAWCTATICAAGSTGLGDVLEIHRGLCNAAEEFGCAVVGGDVSDIDGPIVLDVCAVGTVPAGVF